MGYFEFSHVFCHNINLSSVIQAWKRQKPVNQTTNKLTNKPTKKQSNTNEEWKNEQLEKQVKEEPCKRVSESEGA